MFAKGLLNQAQAAADAYRADAARLTLNKLQRDWHSQLAVNLIETTSRLETARADLEHLQEIASRYRSLADQGAISQVQVDAAVQRTADANIHLQKIEGQWRFIEAQAAVQKVGTNLLFCDGTVRLTPPDSRSGPVAGAVTPRGGEAVDLQRLKRVD